METKYAVIFALNTTYFLLYLALLIFIFIKLRFKLDNVTIFSTIGVLLGLLCRFSTTLVFVLKGYGELNAKRDMKVISWLLLIDALSTSIFHLIAYNFCFEMKFVQVQVKSKSFDDFKARESKVRKLRNLFMIVAITI